MLGIILVTFLLSRHSFLCFALCNWEPLKVFDLDLHNNIIWNKKYLGPAKNICCSPGWQDPDPALGVELGVAPATELLLHGGPHHGAGEAQAEVVLLDPALTCYLLLLDKLGKF